MCIACLIKLEEIRLINLGLYSLVAKTRQTSNVGPDTSVEPCYQKNSQSSVHLYRADHI